MTAYISISYKFFLLKISAIKYVLLFFLPNNRMRHYVSTCSANYLPMIMQ